MLQPLGDTLIRRKMLKLRSCLQYYLSVNLYFSEPLGPNKNYVLINQPWQPIIETKRTKAWQKYIQGDCDSRIREVWNVGVLDYIPGIKHRKMQQNMTLSEAIDETIYQVKRDKYIQNLRTLDNKTFDDVFIGYEVNDTWTNRNGKIYTANPKFSLNPNCVKNLIPIDPKQYSNLWFAAYYCVPAFKNGVSMEASSGIGFTCGRLILKKYKKSFRS